MQQLYNTFIISFCRYIQVDKAVSTDRAQSQWVDLGDLSAACITRPDTCESDGAALSVWLKLTDCQDRDGVISSHAGSPRSAGLLVNCYTSQIR